MPCRKLRFWKSAFPRQFGASKRSFADVDVSFEDRTGTPRFSITWKLVKERGRWKLDEQLSGEKLAA